MINLICKLLLKLAEVLPQSPFASMTDGVQALSSIMGYLNWFIPFRACLGMLTAWCGCMTAYYVYKHGKGVLNKIIGKG